MQKWKKILVILFAIPILIIGFLSILFIYFRITFLFDEELTYRTVKNYYKTHELTFDTIESYLKNRYKDSLNDHPIDSNVWRFHIPDSIFDHYLYDPNDIDPYITKKLNALQFSEVSYNNRIDMIIYPFMTSRFPKGFFSNRFAMSIQKCDNQMPEGALKLENDYYIFMIRESFP